MVGTRKLVRLVEHAGAVAAKVVLVGDPCQLPEIEAGGAFRGLRARLGASVLADNRRQLDAWERDALAELRRGDSNQAIDSYVAHNRVHVASSESEVREQLIEDWMNARVEGENVLMVAPRLADVDDLNRRARVILRNEGYLGDDGVLLAGRGFAEGDDVLALRNDYRVGLLNGTRGSIEQIDLARRTFTVQCDTGEQVLIPFEYLEAGHLTHGYATTIHKAQGATVDRCLVLLDETGAREHAYTALTRGRHGNDVFIAENDRRIEERHATEVELDALDVLRSVMGRSAAQRLALDQVERGSTSLDSMRHERDVLRQRIGVGPPDRGREFRELTIRHQQAERCLSAAHWRRDVAQEELDKLGPIGRRTHRTKRREIEDRIARSEEDVAGHGENLADLDRALAVAPGALARASWEKENRLDLDRLATLDRQIDLAQRFERIAERGLERGLEGDLGIEL